jgi:hypothetical protein
MTTTKTPPVHEVRAGKNPGRHLGEPVGKRRVAYGNPFASL